MASVLTSVLAFSLVASVALASTANYRDQFANSGYSGSNGSLDWSADPWKEVGDDGSYKTGKVQSLASGLCPQGSSCLVIYGQGLNLVGIGASRPADLGEFQSATFSYKLNFVVDDLITAAFLHVEGRAGGAWAPLRTPYVISNGSLQGSVGLPNVYLDDGFEFRFVVNGLLAGDVYIDDVKIEGAVSETTTTSSTSSTSTTTSLPATTTSLPITTTLPTITTTTLPGLLTTSTSSTTTTTTKGTTTTSQGGTGTTSNTSGSSGGQSGGSAGEGTTTSTTGPIGPTGSTVGVEDGGSDVSPPSTGPGIREASVGIQAAFEGDRFGGLQDADFEVMGIDIAPNYSMAVEVFGSSWVYLLVLILLIAAAIVSGLDRRRLKRAKHTDV